MVAVSVTLSFTAYIWISSCRGNIHKTKWTMLWSHQVKCILLKWHCIDGIAQGMSCCGIVLYVQFSWISFCQTCIDISHEQDSVKWPEQSYEFQFECKVSKWKSITYSILLHEVEDWCMFDMIASDHVTGIQASAILFMLLGKRIYRKTWCGKNILFQTDLHTSWHHEEWEMKTLVTVYLLWISQRKW